MTHTVIPPLQATLFYTTVLCCEKEATIHFERDIGRINKERGRRLHSALRAYGEKRGHNVTFPLYWSMTDEIRSALNSRYTPCHQ